MYCGGYTAFWMSEAGGLKDKWKGRAPALAAAAAAAASSEADPAAMIILVAVLFTCGDNLITVIDIDLSGTIAAIQAVVGLVGNIEAVVGDVVIRRIPGHAVCTGHQGRLDDLRSFSVIDHVAVSICCGTVGQ